MHMRTTQVCSSQVIKMHTWNQINGWCPLGRFWNPVEPCRKTSYLHLWRGAEEFPLLQDPRRFFPEIRHIQRALEFIIKTIDAIATSSDERCQTSCALNAAEHFQQLIPGQQAIAILACQSHRDTAGLNLQVQGIQPCQILSSFPKPWARQIRKVALSCELIFLF